MIKKYTTAIKLSFADLIRNWKALIGIVALAFAFGIVVQISSRLGVLGGFLAGLAQVGAYSYYFNWLSLSKHSKAIKFTELKDFNQELFFATLNVAFVFFIIEFILRSFQIGGQNQFFLLAINLLLFIIFNPIAEVIYKERPLQMEAFPTALNFIKEHWLEWLIPILLICLPIFAISPQAVPLILASAEPMLPASILLRVTAVLLQPEFLLFLIIPAHWLMLFRSRFYDQLS